ncbi:MULTISPECIES: triphosphoribosyl-dephospho-CoA synthase [unclassified Caballeronia]|uniref:triphosphoribosyl-dephospho-CoA synthase n=1 Tax=unclassified Caballeronia TaxID=2646786 RepID=UPI001F3F53BF|nr:MULTISPECIES: triphosphoribosyl-dephospho-CoA synthase [unclassified Caballeronia]MCE4545464.1 triphosphoribosyl-dephospho-CoA synthase [Caballeronia sp. PC1]MCE4570890.1 triphosphoribosyl-dephospho-CoA synthase [Caballeronia sp. CLC5]
MNTPSALLAGRARAAFLRACRLDVETMKPGNVSVASAGHGMTSAQFIASAGAAAAGLFTPGARVGARILDAVRRTFDAAGCNTNLGIVLLAAPLCAALERIESLDAASWHRETERVLAELDIDDARLAYRAIALANPGGLGDAPEQSVHAQPTVTLRAAMTLAAGRDSIARQYENGFADIFGAGLDAAGAVSPSSEHRAMLDAFLAFLCGWPDSHIVRKLGAAVAQSVTRDAAKHRADWRAAGRPAQSAELDAWDAALKARGINPGTSADLAVATLFVALMTSAASTSNA